MVRNLVVAAIVTAIAVIVFCAITINDRQSPPGSADRPASIPSAEAAEPAYETLEASEEAEDQETPAATEQDKDAPPAPRGRKERIPRLPKGVETLPPARAWRPSSAPRKRRSTSLSFSTRVKMNKLGRSGKAWMR